MSPRASIVTLVRTAWALGPLNVARVAHYRVRLRLGRHPVQHLPDAPVPQGPFFSPIVPQTGSGVLPAAWPGPHGYFGWREIGLGDAVPDWMHNPLSGGHATGAGTPWWKIPDFDPALGDIKGVWEASRLDWAVRCALRARNGDESAIETLNRWLENWCARNPAYSGPNWKCGQEASIRVMHLALSARLLDTVRCPEPALVALLRTHLRRIDPTLGYAIGQSNNHGTSEAAALFIGGVWLSALGEPDGARYTDRGRRGLEERGSHLILEDGTFSQYSVNYHRLVLDTYSLAECWRRDLAQEPFSDRLIARLSAAVDWLAAMVEPDSGDAPNLGANDGANLLPLTEAPYRDFRPAVQLAGALFRFQRYYTAVASCDAHLRALSVPVPEQSAPAPSSRTMPAGGFILLRVQNRLAVMRVPRHRYRPGHADPLHLDLWVGAVNHLRDDGSFGYNADPEAMRYFGSIRGHNTVQFDDAEPMPRLGRFLWGDWVQASRSSGPTPTADGVMASATYTTASGARHERSVVLSPTRIQVEDRVDGFARRAVWRWRLQPGVWRVEPDGVRSEFGQLHIEADMPIVRLELTEGWESRYYAKRTPVPVVEVEVAARGALRTFYEWTE